jgi:hypothetical protein
LWRPRDWRDRHSWPPIRRHSAPRRGAWAWRASKSQTTARRESPGRPQIHPGNRSSSPGCRARFSQPASSRPASFLREPVFDGEAEAARCRDCCRRDPKSLRCFVVEAWAAALSASRLPDGPAPRGSYEERGSGVTHDLRRMEFSTAAGTHQGAGRRVVSHLQSRITSRTDHASRQCAPFPFSRSNLWTDFQYSSRHLRNPPFSANSAQKPRIRSERVKAVPEVATCFQAAT